VPRAERVRQSVQRGPSVTEFGSYVPADATVEMALSWQRHGADLSYLSSHRTAADVDLDRGVLTTHGFPSGPVFFRKPTESYADVACRAGADVVVEDNCESIGGSAQMISSTLGPGAAQVRCVVVPEFGGLMHLPDDPRDLLGL
jgi:hypothetical protein